MSQLLGVYPPNQYKIVSLELVTLIPRGCGTAITLVALSPVTLCVGGSLPLGAIADG